MNADSQRKAMAFLQWNIPARKQTVPDACVLEGKIGRLDKGHIVATAVGDVAEDLNDWIRGKNEIESFPCQKDDGEIANLSLKILSDRDVAQTVTVRRDALLALLSATESDTVTFSVTSGRALFLSGHIGGRAAAAWIAPLIRQEGASE